MFNKLDLNILKILEKEKAVDEFTGMTMNEINNYYEETKLSVRSNMVKRMKNLIELGYIDKGIKDSRSDTFFITEDGLNRINSKGVRV